MRKITLFFSWIMLALGTLSAQSTFSVLFVDDSDDTFGNAELFAAALDSAGYNFTYFNAVDSAASPTDTYMGGFDLVIWYTSGDGGGLYLWNGADEDNTRLKTYLDNGGNAWIVGTDLLFDRYGAAPDVFQAGDFVYDYMGLKSYDVQAYGDDGGLGVPLVAPDATQPITGLPTINWQFSTLWWVDGVSLRDSAVAIYRMGGSGYTFADSVAGCWYDNGTSKVLSFFFDLSLASNFGLVRTTTESVVSFFESLADTTSSIDVFPATAFKVFPNPANGAFQFTFDLNAPATASAALFDLQGRKVADIFRDQPLPAGPNAFRWNAADQVSAGTYLLRVESDGRVMSRPVMVLP